MSKIAGKWTKRYPRFRSEIGGISFNSFPKVAGGFALLPYAATLCGTQRTENLRLEIAFRLLPLNGRGRLGRDVVAHAVGAGNLGHDAAGNAGQHLVGQLGPGRRHGIGAFHGSQDNRPCIGALVAHHAHAADVGQHGEVLPAAVLAVALAGFAEQLLVFLFE